MSEDELLAEVARDNVTWNKRSFRLWATDDDYTLVTQQVKPLIRAGLVRTQMAAGYTWVNKGYCELTHEGQSRLAALAERGEDE